MLTLPKLFLVSDSSIEVSSVCIVHDNAETSFVHERLFVSDDIGMSHCLQHVYLIALVRRIPTSLIASSRCFLSIFDTSMIYEIG
jgi:hypothetical protein